MPVRKKVAHAPVFEVKRQAAKTLMDLLLSYEPKVHYAQVRPMQTNALHTIDDLTKALKSAKGITCDCSESSTLIARLAGFLDPNGRHFDGIGYTGTIIEHLAKLKIPVAQAQVGDLIVFGSYPGHHVCMVYEPGVNPVLFSHGQERGPIAIHLSDEAAYQPKPVQAYSIV